MRRIESVLLDIDGTLLDSNEAHAQSWKTQLDKEGIPASLQQLRLLMGMGGDKILRKITGSSLTEGEAKRISKRRDELYLKDCFPHVKAFPGVIDLMKALVVRGQRVALATSATQELLDAMLRKLPIQDYVVGHATASEAGRSKPDHDIFEAAVKKFGFERNRTVAIGDSPYDVEAARRLPCYSIAVCTGGYPSYMLSTATEIYDDIVQLTRSIDKSMFAV